MEKKLTAQGPTGRKSYTVTLPLWWVKDNGLDKTKVVDLEVVGDKAIIQSSKKEGKIEVLDGKKYTNAIIKVLQGLYRLGSSEIKVFYKDTEQLEVITRLIHTKLIGYEIIEQNNSYCLIKDITGTLEEKFDVVLRRIFLLIVEQIKAKDSREIDSFDSNISRLTNYCQRLLIKKGHLNYIKVPIYYLVVDQLEKLKDEISWLLSHKVSKKDQRYVVLVHGFIQQLYFLYCSFKKEEFEDLVSATYILRKEIRSQKEVSIAELHIHNIVRLINSISTNVGILKHK